MNLMLTFKHWKDEHNIHFPDMHEIKLGSEKLIHSPLFWLLIALIAFIGLMAVMGYFATPEQTPQFPVYPYGGGYPVFP